MYCRSCAGGLRCLDKWADTHPERRTTCDRPVDRKGRHLRVGRRHRIRRPAAR